MSVFIGFSGAPAGTSPGGSIAISAGQIVGRSPTETGSGAASGKSLGNGIGWNGGQVVATTQMSVTADASGIRLVGDAATPGGSKYYGTDAGGNRGYWALPAGGATNISVLQSSVAVWIGSSSGSGQQILQATDSRAGVMSADDMGKFNSMAQGATANESDAYLLNRANHSGTQNASTISDFAAAARVQVAGALVAGANISITEGGSGAALQKIISAANTNLATTRSGAAVTITSSTGQGTSLDLATGLLAGVMSAADKSKLDGIAAGATANASNAALRDRSTHTGEQPASTISDLAANTRMQVQSMLVAGSNVSLTSTGFGDSLQITVDVATGGPGSTNLGTTAGSASVTISSSTGTSADIDAATPSLAGVMSAADKSKLDGIAAGATVNASNAALRDRSTHTGLQPSATIADFAAAVRAEVEAMLLSGANITLTASGTGSGRQVTVSSTGGGSMPSVVPISAGGTGSTTAQGAVTALTTSLARTGTTANFTLLASDSGAIIETEATSPITITVPADLPAGFNCVIVQGNTGKVTLVASGVLLKSHNNQLSSGGLYAAISIFPGRASGTYIVSGATSV